MNFSRPLRVAFLYHMAITSIKKHFLKEPSRHTSWSGGLSPRHASSRAHAPLRLGNHDKMNRKFKERLKERQKNYWPAGSIESKIDTSLSFTISMAVKFS